MWNGSQYVFIRSRKIKLINFLKTKNRFGSSSSSHSNSFPLIYKRDGNQMNMKWICSGIRKRGDYFPHWNLYTRSQAYGSGSLKDWDCEGFNESEWTDSSLITMQYIVVSFYAKAFPMTSCSTTTAPHSQDNHRKLTGKCQPTFPPSPRIFQLCHSTGMWTAWLRRKTFQIRWFSD